MDGAEQVNG